MARINICIILIFIAHNIFAQTNIINGIRLWPGQNNTRIVLDLQIEQSKVLAKKNKKLESLEYTNFNLENPNRLVVDIKDGTFIDSQITKNLSFANTPINNLRYSKQNSNLRLVFDLKSQVESKLFIIPPVTNMTNMTNHRLVIDVKKKVTADHVMPTGSAVSQAISPTVLPSDKEKNVILKRTNEFKFKNKNKNKNKNNDDEAELDQASMPLLTSMDSYRKKKFTVIIDPGHGGDDPGAVGPAGTMEKDVALSVSYYLKRYIDQDEDLRAIMTRTSDYYIGLRERTQKARANQADLFVSIHADGFKDMRASGSSVFVLSERGASSELAKWIAAHENASDLVGGVHLESKDPMLTTVLLDLSQTASNRASYQVANKVLQQMAVITDLHKTTVEKAAFMVLRSPDIPSILVETGFISNPRGERDLLSSVHQKKIAYAIYKGVKSYFKMYPRPSWSDELIQARN